MISKGGGYYPRAGNAGARTVFSKKYDQKI